ncbi:MAG: patatin-like phospholipase family protein [Nitrososphaeraceae archaeon]|jgi:NTE family protein
MSTRKSAHHSPTLESETVLVLQGGGSLGAYECGVYKGFNKNGIIFDVLAGSSIGAINTSIIASAQNAGIDEPSSILEDFWLSLSENMSFPNQFLQSPFPFMSSDEMMAIWSSFYSMLYGNPKAFLPRWFNPDSKDYFMPYKWTYLYDKTPLKKTLKQYIDIDKLKKIDRHRNSNNNKDNKAPSRLIITSTDIQKGEPVIFDSAYSDIDIDKIVACAGYPFYGLRWTEKDGKYLWDGSLLTNTPMLEVLRRSPQINKKFYIVDVFPRQQKELPTNMIEVWHRARDIVFMDKTDKNIEMLKVTEKYLSLIKTIYDILHDDAAKVDQTTKNKLKEIELEYHSLNQKHGASITDLVRIGRREGSLHYLFEDADFSTYRIKKLIAEGEKDVDHILAKQD